MQTIVAQIVVMEAGLPGQPLEQAVKLFLLIDGMIIVTIIFVLVFLVAVIPEINVDSLPIPPPFDTHPNDTFMQTHSQTHQNLLATLNVTYILAVLEA